MRGAPHAEDRKVLQRDLHLEFTKCTQSQPDGWHSKKELSAKNKRDLQELTNKAVQFSTLAFARAFCTVAPDLAVWASWPWNCTHRKAMVVLKSSGHDKHQLFQVVVEGK